MADTTSYIDEDDELIAGLSKEELEELNADFDDDDVRKILTISLTVLFS